MSVDHLGVLVEGGPAARGTSSSGNVDRAAVGDLVGDQGSLDVDPGADGTPHDKDEVLARLVAELGNVVTVIANPGSVASIGGLGVLTSQAAESLEEGSEETAFLNDGLGDGGSTAEGQVGEENGGKVEAHLDG